MCSETIESTRKTLAVGSIELSNRVILAPMSGVTDRPFRALCQRLGAGLVVTEMIASEDLVRGRPEVLRRSNGRDLTPHVVQLAGREGRWMGEGARMAAANGADIIDINMGCPAKQVTRGRSGSALMRDIDHALSLIDAVVAAVEIPVTLKMRMGWDEHSLNAPELARRAEAAGVQMITVHGRTRCQFFRGTADWSFISKVKAAVGVPVIANGDIVSLGDVNQALKASGADGVMIGRGAYGRPWLPGQAASLLRDSEAGADPSLSDQCAIVLEHYDEMLTHYGIEMGARNARKHLGWYIDSALIERAQTKYWRGRLCRENDPASVKSAIAEFYDRQLEAAA